MVEQYTSGVCGSLGHVDCSQKHLHRSIAHAATGRDLFLIDPDACVQSPHDLKLPQTPEVYCFTTFNILTLHYCEL